MPNVDEKNFFPSFFMKIGSFVQFLMLSSKIIFILPKTKNLACYAQSNFAKLTKSKFLFLEFLIENWFPKAVFDADFEYGIHLFLNSIV